MTFYQICNVDNFILYNECGWYFKISRVLCFWELWFVLGFFSVSVLNERNYKRKLTKITAINYFSFRQSRGFLATLVFFYLFLFTLQFFPLWCSPLCPTTLVFLFLLALASVSTLHLFCWTGCRASYITTFKSSCWNWLQPACWSYTCWVNLLSSM